MLTAVAPSAGTGTVDVTLTTAAGTSPVDTAKDSFIQARPGHVDRFVSDACLTESDESGIGVHRAA